MRDTQPGRTRPTGTLLICGLTMGVLSLLAASVLQAQGTPRLAPVPESQWSPELRAIAAEFAATGMTNLAATYANHDQLAQALMPHLAYIWSDSALPARHRALLSLRTLWLTRAEYLWAHRAERALEEGLTTADLERIARGPDADGWSPFEARVIRAADELVVDAFISDATWNALDAEYDLPALIDTIDTVGALTMHAGFARTLGVGIEPSVGARLPAEIPYAVAAERTNIRLVDLAPRIPPEIPEGANFAANVFYTFRHNPPADRVRGAINTQVTGRSTLDPLHREFLLVRIGTLCRSEYEYAAHVRVGRGAGMTDADLALILAGPESGGGDPLKRALLWATDELHRDVRISDATWNELSGSLDTRQMLDLLVAVGGYRSTSMLINSAGVQLDANMADFRFPPELR